MYDCSRLWEAFGGVFIFVANWHHDQTTALYRLNAWLKPFETKKAVAQPGILVYTCFCRFPPPPKKNRPIGVGRDAYQGCQHKPLLATGILGRGHTENYSRQNSARENIQKAARGKLMYPCPVFHHPSRVRFSNRSAKILFVCGPSRVKTIHQNNDIRITKYLANI